MLPLLLTDSLIQSRLIPRTKEGVLINITLMILGQYYIDDCGTMLVASIVCSFERKINLSTERIYAADVLAAVRCLL